MRAALISAVFAALAVSTNGAAIEKRQEAAAPAAAPALTDADILNFATVLEHLEATFYSQALSNFSASDFTKAGYASNIRANIVNIAADEAQHVEFLNTALTAAGATPVQACKYNFPYTDVHGFLGLSMILEGVGVSAYLGAAQFIQNKDYLTAAGSILTAEARHSAFIRYVNQYSPFVTEDTPLTPTSIQSLATPFFVSCPDGSAPPFTPFPAATLASPNATIGDTISVTYANSSQATGESYCVFLSGLGQASAPYADGKCTIPTANMTTGQAYGVISSARTFSDATVLAGPFILQFDTKNNTSGGPNGSVSGGNSTVGSNAAAAAAGTGAASKTGPVAAAAGLGMGLVATAAALLF